MSNWISVNDDLITIPENEPLTGYSPDWIDDDCNPKGIRECFLNGDGNWVSAKWFDYQDTYVNDEKTSPTDWMPLPEPPQ